MQWALDSMRTRSKPLGILSVYEQCVSIAKGPPHLFMISDPFSYGQSNPGSERSALRSARQQSLRTELNNMTEPHFLPSPCLSPISVPELCGGLVQTCFTVITKTEVSSAFIQSTGRIVVATVWVLLMLLLLIATTAILICLIYTVGQNPSPWNRNVSPQLAECEYSSTQM